MPDPHGDWLLLVEQRLSGLRVPADRRAEICRELAAHLEDEYSELCSGLPEAEARQRVLRLLAKPEELQRIIWITESEDHVNKRLQALVMPGLVSLVFSGFLLIAIGSWGPDPRRVALMSDHPPLVLYPLWLLALPLFGALGAWLAKQAEATVPQRLLAGLFPLLTMAVAFYILLPLAMIVDGIPIEPIWMSKWLLLSTLNWIVIPSVPLLLGARPFVLDGGRRPEDAS